MIRPRGWMWWTVAGLSLWLRTGFPIRAIGGAVFDDALFLRQAGTLGAGQWLGAYDEMTLAKGVFYPVFILAAFVAGMPLNLAEQALYLLACAGMAAVLARLAGGWLGLAGFAALAFNPVLLSWELTRVIREAVYVGLSLGMLALLAGLAFAPPRRPALSALGLGLLGGAYWLTREEGVWLLPALAVVVAFALPRAGWRLLPPLALAGLVAGLVVGAVAWRNQAAYGMAIANEFKSDAFQRGYGALARIRHDEFRRYVVFPQDARLRAYAASPAAAELRPLFEGPAGEVWRQAGCSQTGTADCPEILSGWFMWALRQAVARAGHARSPAAAAAFYDRLADEIDAACTAGRLSCEAPRATLLPVFRAHYLLDALRAAPTIAWMLAGMGEGMIGATESSGRRVELLNFADAVGPIYPAGETLRFADLRLPGPAAELHLRGGDAPFGSSIDRELVTDAAGGRATRFVVMTDCRTACALVLGDGTAIDWAQLATGPLPAGMAVARVSDWNPARAGSLRRAMLTRIAAAMGRAYGLAVPALSALALLGLGLSLLRARRRNPALLALALASLAAVACRVGLLAYLEVTSIPAANLLYAAPASPFLILFAITGCLLGAQAMRRGDAREMPI